MKYIQNFESRYKASDIDKQFYVWKKPGFSGYNIAVIEIFRVIKKTIYYAIHRRYGGWKDFFTNSKPADNTINGNRVSLNYWKSHMATDLLFATDDLDDAHLFYNLYTNGEPVTKDNFEMYKNSIKYNL